MSLSRTTLPQRTQARQFNREKMDYGIVLALVCLALAVILACALFTPVSLGNDGDHEVWLIGP